MIIYSVHPYKSLSPLKHLDLPNFTVISGVNGSGKTHLLEGISRRIVELLDIGDSPTPVRNEHGAPVKGDIRSLTSIKLVDHNFLVPNESAIYDPNAIRAVSNALYQLYSHNRSVLKDDPRQQLEKAFHDEKQKQIIKKIAASSGKPFDELDKDDFIYYFPYEGDIQGSNDGGSFFYQNFTALFKRYQIKKYMNEFRQFRYEKYGVGEYMSDEEFVEIHGEPPWILVNQIFKEANLHYRVRTPEGEDPETPFQATLINELNGATVNFNELSSGEKVITGLTLALYNSLFDIVFPEVLLLDEPDAHLHPSLAKQFLQVLQSIFVRDKGLKVLITTHSPSTVALAPEESLFVMNKVEPRLVKATKDHALRNLTAGVPTLSIDYENRRQVFVESKYDATYYENIYEKLRDKLIPEISLSFISSGVGGIGSSNAVREVVNKLAGYGNRTVYGIIDWDTKNNENQYVKILGKDARHSIENYILDPILVAAFLLREKLVPDPLSLGLESADSYSNFIKLDSEKLKRAANHIVNLVSAKLGNPVNTGLSTCEYVGGLQIQLPVWFLTIQGHAYEDLIKELFPCLKAYKGKLKDQIISKVIDDVPELIPMEFLVVMMDIQGSL